MIKIAKTGMWNIQHTKPNEFVMHEIKYIKYHDNYIEFYLIFANLCM